MSQTCKNCQKKLDSHSLARLQLCLHEFEDKVDAQLQESKDRADRTRLESLLGDK